MYPFIRLGTITTRALLKRFTGQRLHLEETSEIHLRCNLNDIDNFLELNNGRIFTLFDLARTDFAIRSGLGKQLLRHRWGLVVAGSTIQYRRRVRWRESICIKTRIAAIDERWIYVEQSMWSQDRLCSSALLRTAVTYLSTGKPVPVREVLHALDYDKWTRPADEWVQAWIDADKKRPMPTLIS